MIGDQKRIRKLGMAELRFYNRVPYQPWGGADPGGQKVPRHNESPTAVVDRI